MIGGPDDAFEVSADPVTGQHNYTPIAAVQDYLRGKAQAAADARQRGRTARDHLDAVGRLANAVRTLEPDRQADSWSDGRATLGRMGFDMNSIPETFDPSLVRWGETVPQAAASQARQDTLQLGRDRLGVSRDQGAERLSQGRQRIALAGQAGVRADRSQARQDLKAGIVDGYQYRRDPVSGKLQKRKVQ